MRAFIGEMRNRRLGSLSGRAAGVDGSALLRPPRRQSGHDGLGFCGVREWRHGFRQPVIRLH
jgi:hypothetical protein